MVTLTVVTYNIYGGSAREALAEVVTALEPDVVVANEAPRLPLLWRWKCSRLAADWGLRRAAGGRDAGQNLLCVSPGVQVHATSAQRLSQPLFAPMRGVVAAQCSMSGVDFGVVGVHLSLRAESRPAEARAAVEIANRLRGPIVLCGDLNERPGQPAWRVFEDAGFADFGAPGEPTFSSTDRRKRIDVVLVRNATVLSYGVPELAAAAYERASDHCPVRAVIELPG